MVSDFLREKNGKLSATRIVGVSSAFTLMVVTLVQAFSPMVVEMGDRLVEALEYITISCLLWSQVGKFAERKPTPEE